MLRSVLLLATLLVLIFAKTSFSLSFIKKSLFKKAYKNIHQDRKLLRDSSEAWIEQKLDNFHPTDDRTWFQRYFMQESYSKSSGPVFLQIGGEGPASAVWMSNGHWIEMAKKVNALCFQLEHRYYGLSQPTKDVGLSNLVYLNSEQALADLSNFVTSMNKKYSLHNRKWIVFGGSYPGSLAVWARLKYPHLISGAVSASAPLDALLDFSAYNEVVQHSLNTLGDPKCASRIATATQKLSELLSSGKRDYVVSEIFPYTCGKLTSFDDQYFQQSLADNIAEVVQYNRDFRSFEGNVDKVMNITELCGIMKVGNDNPVHLLYLYASANKLILDYSGVGCFDASYSKYLSEMKNSSWEAAPSAREWVYQTCTEFGWYQTAIPSQTQPFRGFPLSFFERECDLLFGIKGEELRESVRRTNTMYGNLDVVHQVTNTTLYNGLIDPWSNVSYIGQFKSNQVPIEVVDDTAHCAIMYPNSDQDSSGLVKARQQVEMQVFKWLGIAK